MYHFHLFIGIKERMVLGQWREIGLKGHLFTVKNVRSDFFLILLK